MSQKFTVVKLALVLHAQFLDWMPMQKPEEQKDLGKETQQA